MIVVGYLYNNNGMATWCLETAAALHYAGQRVLLIHSSAISLPSALPYKTMAFDLPASDNVTKGAFRKASKVIQMLSGKSNGFSYLIYQELIKNSFKPKCFFLNQSDMLDKRVPVPQYLCAWVYPFNIWQYLVNGYRAGDKRSLKKTLLSIIFSLSFYRKDYFAYKAATKVLSLSPLMEIDLLRKKTDTILLSPCCSDKVATFKGQFDKTINLLIAALDLDNPRKNVVWMLEAINDLPAGNFKITLIGNPGPKVNGLIQKSQHPIDVKGQLPRDKALPLFAQADIFLFASTVDDWGYVLVEAMMNRLALLVPDKNPYNYIIEDKKCVFKPNCKKDFQVKLTGLLQYPGGLETLKIQSRERALKLFTGEVFAKKAHQFLINN